MSICAYTGLPGSGKSYGVVQHVVLPALENNRRVVTNIPMHMETVLKQYPNAQIDQFKTEDIDPFWFQAQDLKGVVFVIDEVWRLWPSGMKATQCPEGHRSFLAEHRHMVGDDGYTTEIILVTQDLAQIANFARQLVEETFRAEKLSKVGQSKSYRVDVYTGSVTGQKPPQSAKLREFYGKYKKEIYQYYSSHTMGGGVVGSESKLDKRANVLKSAPILIGIPAGLLMAISGVTYAVSLFTSGDLMNTGPIDQEPQQVQVSTLESQFNTLKTRNEAPVPQVETAPAEPPKPQLSQSLRLVGVIQKGKHHFAVIADRDGRYRRIDPQLCEEKFGDLTCEYNGEIVTQYTGRYTQASLLGDTQAKASSYVPQKSTY